MRNANLLAACLHAHRIYALIFVEDQNPGAYKSTLFLLHTPLQS